MNVVSVLLLFDTSMGILDLVAMLLAFLYVTVHCLRGLLVPDMLRHLQCLNFLLVAVLLPVCTIHSQLVQMDILLHDSALSFNCLVFLKYE